MEWLQREQKLAYHFENTTDATEEMKRVQRQYSPVRAIGNFHFSGSAFYRSSGLLLNHYRNDQHSSRVTNVSFVVLQSLVQISLSALIFYALTEHRAK